MGKVSIDLEEPSLIRKSRRRLNLVKKQKKDPQIKNTGVNDAFVYLEVAVPMADVETAAEDGTRLDLKNQELFSFQASSSWTKLSSRKVGEDQIYVYAYNQILKPEQTTDALFDSVKFINLIEDSWMNRN